MEEQQRDLRQLVMKRAADRTVAGSGVASPAPRGEPLIQQVPKKLDPHVTNLGSLMWWC